MVSAVHQRADGSAPSRVRDGSARSIATVAPQLAIKTPLQHPLRLLAHRRPVEGQRLDGKKIVAGSPARREANRILALPAPYARAIQPRTDALRVVLLVSPPCRDADEAGRQRHTLTLQSTFAITAPLPAGSVAVAQPASL